MYGMCHNRHGYRYDEDLAHTDHTPVVATAPRDPDERIGDADRERAAALLSQAFRDGLLRVDEFDQRLSSVYAATTAGDLDAATADLPDGWVSDLHSLEEAQQRSERHRRHWRGGLQSYLRVMALLVGIWLLTAFASVGDGELPYFWPAWPMLGWGIPLFLSRPRGPIARSVRHRRMARAH